MILSNLINNIYLTQRLMRKELCPNLVTSELVTASWQMSGVSPAWSLVSLDVTLCLGINCVNTMEHLDFFLVISSSEYPDVRYTCLIWEHLHFSPADRGHSGVVTGHLVWSENISTFSVISHLLTYAPSSASHTCHYPPLRHRSDLL